MPIKVLLADDSGLMRLLVSDILKGQEDIEVVGTASNGKDAFEKTLTMSPDVVVMDLNMGEYGGLFGIQQIMQTKPTPILVLSAVGNNDFSSIEQALNLGAIDYINKPSQNNTKVHEVGGDLINKIRVSAGVVLQHKNNSSVPIVNNLIHTFSNLAYDVVVIGSSTGGPGAVESILSKLPQNMAVPVLIAQHMPPNFVPSFANRLNDLYPLNIQMARKGDLVEPGKVLVAPGSRNMIVRSNHNNKVEIDFTTKTFKEYNYPSVDCLMESVAEVYGSRSIGVILTGMGKDGAAGMNAIFGKGGYTIAQSQETCIVYGMPKEVVERGIAKAIVPISEIGGFLVSCLS